MTQLKRGTDLPRRTGKREIIRERNNRLTIRETWQYDSDTFLADIPAEESAHPEFTTTYLQGPVVGSDEAGVTTAVQTWVGFDASAGGSSPNDSPPRYWWDGADRTVPIQYLNRDGRDFGALVDSAVAGGYEPLDSAGRFIEFPPGAQSPNAHDIGGLTDYLDVGGSWNIERFASTPPDIANSCRWMSPGDVPGGAPTILTNTTWLYLTPSYEKVATGVYFVKEKLVPSQGDAPWNPDIYEEYA